MGDGVRTWRPSVLGVLRILLPALFFAAVAALAAADRAWPGGTTGNTWWLAYGVVGLVVCSAGSITLAARTRVRLLADGLEVRQWKARVHPYDSIVDATVDRAGDDRTIRLTLRDGKSVTLPCPTRGLGGPSLDTLDAAVAAIRDRSGLGPAAPRLP